jgi:4-diphosphocytidyl-2-C-methyl-D-erythritol kinase
VSRGRAYAKINLALVVGPQRADGKHEVVTVLQRIDLHDEIEVEPADALVIEGFTDDTIVYEALLALAEAAGTASRWRVRIDKSIPVAAGLGGGSSDAATALQLANVTLDAPRSSDELHRIAAQIGADVPFFLYRGAQLATGDGTELTPVDLPSDYWVVLVTPDGDAKESTGKVYGAFDERAGADGFPQRADSLCLALAAARTPRDLARLPANDLASSSLARELIEAGAFRADVSGAGPTVFGLFESATDADSASASLQRAGRTLVTRPIDADDLPRVAR